MMDYEVFKSVVTARIKEFLPSVYAKFEVKTERVPKINGMKDAMVVFFETEDYRMSGPNIYLDDLYRAFTESEDMDLLLKDAACKIMAFTGTQMFDKGEFADLDQYKDDIVKVLINTEMNSGLLEVAPHKEYLDLSVTYRLAVDDADGRGYSTALITNELIQEFGMTVDELDELAEKNSRRKLAVKVIPVSPELRMMATTGMIFGGINLQRKDEIRKIADELESDLYLLPSSIHDIMVFGGTLFEDESVYFNMLKDGNETCNDEEEILSYNIYFYDREKDMLEIRYNDRK